ncbi:MAG: LPS-assembly protein LptD [Candidatus Methylomirabilales bacterium]
MRVPAKRLSFGLILPVGLLALASALPVMAQGVRAPTEFTVSADFLESREGGRLLAARGNVRITRENWTLYADEVDVDQDEETFVARGSILVFDRGNQIQGSSLRYNYGTGQGVIREAHGFILPSTTFVAEEAYREDERTYRLVEARYSSCAVCQTPPYDWEFRAKEVTVHPEEFAWGTHGTFWIKDIPAMYLPVFRHPLGDRQTGFLTPTFGQNSQEGTIVGEQFFWVISDSQDATLGVIYRSERGVSPTVEYRYALGDGKGLLGAQYLYDRELEENRYLVTFRGEQTFAPALTGKADINIRSDPDFPEQFAPGYLERTNLVNNSSAYLTYALPRHTISLSAMYDETRAPDAPEQDDALLRGPELTVSSLAQPLWEESPLLFEQESAFVYFDQKNEISVSRLDLHPSLSLPIALTSSMTATPRIGFRETAYSRGAQDIESDAVTRTLVEAGAELSSRLFRTFPVHGERLQAIRHTVESSIGYLYIPEVTQDDIPQLDGTDFISPQNRFFLSLTNRLSASVQTPEGGRQRFDFLTITLATSVTPDPQTRTFSDLFLNSLQAEDITQAVKGERVPIPDRPGFSKATERQLANIVARMSITPPWPLSLDLSGSFNPDAGDVETGNATLRGSYEDVASFGLGYTFSRSANQEAWIANLGLTILEGTRLTYLGRYDAERGLFLENTVGLIYQTCCWAISLIYTHRDTDNPSDPKNDVRLNVELLTAPSRR